MGQYDQLVKTYHTIVHLDPRNSSVNKISGAVHDRRSDNCDVCPIIGRNHVCRVCVDYDLCQGCFDLPVHNLVRNWTNCGNLRWRTGRSESDFWNPGASCPYKWKKNVWELRFRQHRNSVSSQNWNFLPAVRVFQFIPLNFSNRSEVEIRIKIQSVLSRIEHYLDLVRSQREKEFSEISFEKFGLNLGNLSHTILIL